MAKVRKPVTRTIKILYETQCSLLDDFALAALVSEEISKGETRAIFAKIAGQVLERRRSKKAA